MPILFQKEYLHLAIKFNIDFSNKTVEEKAEFFFFFLNVVVDEKCYRSILNYTPGKQAIKELEIMLHLSSINQLQLSHFMLV